MDIVEIKSTTNEHLSDLLALMQELTSNIIVTPEMLTKAIHSPETHLFAAINDGHIVGCASLCVFNSPTGRKASIEDVVVLSTYRGRHFGRDLMKYLISYAKKELTPVDLHLTSNPQRVVANELYKSFGFVKKDTNAYVMKIV